MFWRKIKFKLGFHPFHIVDLSPWPIMGSVSVFNVVMNIFHYLNNSGNFQNMVISVGSLALTSILWWKDVIRESTFQGKHSKKVQNGLVLGVIMFICSELMFFFSFFFGFFFSSLNPDISIGSMWPPSGIEPLSFMMVPLLNSLILLSSGVSITWSHHSMLENNFNSSKVGMLLTIIMGVIFLFFQYEEYYSGSFTMSDSVFGSFFYLMTGFHGLHVIIGVIFIMTMFFRFLKNHFSSNHHLGFESAAWYWHFVDVVWLFLFLVVYWWGS